MTLPAALGSWAAWNASSDDERAAVMRVILAELGDEYEDAGLVGTRRMGAVRHRATAYELVIVPGGSFTMGISDDEEHAILDMLAALPSVSAEEVPVFRREVAAIAKVARPCRAVTIEPFLCGRRHRHVPAPSTWRIVTEAEWEYVARASYPDGWILDPPRVWNNMEAPERAYTQESPLGLFDLVSWDGERFADEDGWTRGGPAYGWASEVAGVWAFFVGARCVSWGTGERAALSLDQSLNAASRR